MISMYYVLREQLAIPFVRFVFSTYIHSRELIRREVAGIWKRKDIIEIKFTLCVPRDIAQETFPKRMNEKRQVIEKRFYIK